MNRLIKFFVACALVLGFQVPAFAQSAFEEVIVTAQRTEESLQDVPIAVTAFSSDDLDLKQVVTFSDLQLNVPGLSYGQTNFGGASINLRGIGALSTGASFDQSVSYHVNEAPIATSAVGLEQFDVARVEVLRGPQGTLFGRGATGGAINAVTNSADFDETYGKLKVTAGSFNTQKFEAMANVSISDNLAVRFAGYDLQRDGYIDNLFLPDTDYDGRNQTAGRMSISWDPSERISVSAMFENYNEESTRALKGRYVCDESPTPNRGCTLGGTGSDLANPSGVYDGIIASALLETAPAGAGVAGYKSLGLLVGNEVRPTNLGVRQVHADFAPIWKRDSETVQFNISYELDAGSLSFNYTGQDGEAYDRGDTDMAVNPAIGAVGTYAREDLNPSYTGVPLLDGCAGDWCGYTGPTKAEEMAGNASLFSKYTIVNAKRGTFIDGTTSNGSQDYYELKFISDFDGPHNFLLGINSYEAGSTSRYLTVSSPLAMLASAVSYYPSNFGTLTNYDLDATGIFGEYYYEINNDMKLTIGARFADETKTLDDFRTTYYMGRNINAIAGGIAAAGQGYLGWPTNGDNKLVHATLWSSCVEGMTGTLTSQFLTGAKADALSRTDTTCSEDAKEVIGLYDGAMASITSATTAYRSAKIAYGTNAALNNGTATADATAAYGLALATFMGAVSEAVPSMYVQNQDYSIAGWPAYKANEFDYETTSGRIVFDWQYDENSMMYASYSRGVKPAGINPAANPRVYKPCFAGSSGGVSWTATSAANGCVDIPAQTKKEEVDTYELGVKTDLLDGQLRLNANVFFSDYSNLQIASVVAATTYNFNSDADISGAELELAYLPENIPGLRVDFMLSLLDTEITSDDKRINPFNKLGVGTSNDISSTHHEIKCTEILYRATGCIGNNFVVKKADLMAKAPTALGGDNTFDVTGWLTGLGTIQGLNGATATSLPTYGDRNCYDLQTDCASSKTYYGIDTITGSIQSLKGNQLPQAPEFSGNLSVSYDFTTSNGYTFIPSASYYFQDESFSTEYNATISDVIDSWDEINLGLLIVPAQGDWSMKVYARNVTDEDNVTTKYNSTDITGNFQSWQYRDPRTVGVEFMMDF